jgi:type I restriction enzyme R subunit
LCMWITGFDVQSLSTIYLDKPMRNHALMQTIARANRVFEGKTNGLIVDYIGVFRNLQKALSIYAKPGKGVELPVKNKKQLIFDLHESIDQTKKHCESCNINLDHILSGSAISFEKIALMDDAVDRLIANEEIKRHFLQLAGLSWKLFKAILPDRRAYEYEDICQCFHSLLGKIRTLTPFANIEEVTQEIEQILDLSIDAHSYIITDDVNNIIDLSGLDFEKMRRDFEKKHKNIELQKLRVEVEQVLYDMIEKNMTRTDYLKRFEEMIADYNSGSKNVDIIYKNLIDFAEALNEEQKRHMQENLSEEELAMFDILIKPEMELGEKEKQQVKKVARQLLETLKKEKLVLDWRKKQQARADVLYTIEKILDDELPRSYSTEIYHIKCEKVYQHIYDNYYGAGRSVYSIAG